MSKKPIYKSKLFYVALALLALAGYGMKLKDEQAAPVAAVADATAVADTSDAPPTDAPTATRTASQTVEPTVYRFVLSPGVYDYVVAAHYVPNDAPDDGPYRCDYTVKSTKSATITWTDGAQAHTVTGDAGELARLYVDLLSMEAWQSCTYSVKNHPMIGFGESKGKETLSTIGNYITRISDALDVHPTPTPSPTPTARPVQHDYVLNMNTMVFHEPGCPSAAQIKASNKKNVHATRDKVLEKGYSPCGQCHP